MTPIEISHRADADLDDILDYGIRTYGRERAELYLRMIHATFARIGEYAGLGMVRSDLAENMRSLSAGEHRVFYRYDGTVALIVRVLHKRMDAARWM